MIDWFENFWQLYSSAFPPDERRLLEHQKKIFNNPGYYAEAIYSQNEWAGFITWWDLDSFTYIEHFAIDPQFRNMGLGRSFLKSFIEKHNTIVLEVEYPGDNLSKRRIKFYEQLGFKLLDNDYLQPPYDKTRQAVPLKIMILPYGSIDFETIRNNLYKRVYKN